jgi:hypothetical protein
MSSKSKHRRRGPNVLQVTDAALTMFLWAYCNVHDPDTDDMENMSREIQKVQEGVSTGRLRIPEIKEALKDEYGWEVIR